MKLPENHRIAPTGFSPALDGGACRGTVAATKGDERAGHPSQPEHQPSAYVPRPAVRTGRPRAVIGTVPRLLIVHHTPSPSTQALFEAVVAGATADEIEGVEVVRRPALAATPLDAMEADGYILGTPANIGYMSGALKVFFDRK